MSSLWGTHTRIACDSDKDAHDPCTPSLSPHPEPCQVKDCVAVGEPLSRGARPGLVSSAAGEGLGGVNDGEVPLLICQRQQAAVIVHLSGGVGETWRHSLVTARESGRVPCLCPILVHLGSHRQRCKGG